MRSPANPRAARGACRCRSRLWRYLSGTGFYSPALGERGRPGGGRSLDVLSEEVDGETVVDSPKVKLKVKGEEDTFEPMSAAALFEG